jgi:hypothetical protein
MSYTPTRFYFVEGGSTFLCLTQVDAVSVMIFWISAALLFVDFIMHFFIPEKI